MDVQNLSASNIADAVGVTERPVICSGFLVCKYMFFCASASLGCVLGGDSKKVATEKKGEWMKVFVLYGFSIWNQEACIVFLYSAYTCLNLEGKDAVSA